MFKKVKCSVKWAFHLITCLPNTLKKKTGYVRALYAKFLYFVKGVDHMGCYVVLRRENEGNCTFCKYIIVLSASDTLYTKLYPGWHVPIMSDFSVEGDF